MTVLDRLYTIEEFEQLLTLPENQDRLLELMNGAVVEKMPTEEHGMIASNVNIELGSYVKQHKAGRVGIEVRHRVMEDRLNSRLSDLSFTCAQRPVVKRGSVPHLPDIAIEIKSPDNFVKQFREKVEYYLANGVQLVWLVYPQQRMVEVYSLDGDVEILLDGDLLTGGAVLPGFSMPVAEVFADPLAE
ncbi:MAG: Uma2 family endonuclease [Caldilineaceae bacterium]